MNKRVMKWALAIIILVILADKLNLFGILFELVFLGMIPWTNLSIPPVIMMIFYPIAIVAAVFWLAHQPLYIGSKEKQEKTARAVARKRVAKKTSKAAVKRKAARA